MNVRRGEVWLVDFGDPVGREQSGRRPAVVISADALNESGAGVIVVVPTTTAPRGLPSHVEIDPGGSGLDPAGSGLDPAGSGLDPAGSGLDEVSYAKCEDVESVSEQRLIERLGVAGEDATFQIARVLRFLLDL